jgi:hypothetical protein
MKKFPNHKWLNLKNAWDNHKRVTDMFNSTYVDEILAIGSLIILATIAYITIGGN